MDTKQAGRKGGFARAKTMTKKERSESASKAATARHAKNKSNRKSPAQEATQN